MLHFWHHRAQTSKLIWPYKMNAWKLMIKKKMNRSHKVIGDQEIRWENSKKSIWVKSINVRNIEEDREDSWINAISMWQAAPTGTKTKYVFPVGNFNFKPISQLKLRARSCCFFLFALNCGRVNVSVLVVCAKTILSVINDCRCHIWAFRPQTVNVQDNDT